MLLSELLAGYHVDEALRDLEIAGASADSREISDGFAFFAIQGFKGDGLTFVEDARARGARVVVATRPVNTDLPVVLVDDVRAALSRAASKLYPRQPETIVAVTGTSGKSSVVDFLRQIWTTLGREAASLGTVGVVDRTGAHYGALTTPGPVALHETLQQLAGRSITHLAMEASSLGIDQRRLDGVRLSAGAFTNFSRDHLDHHASLEDYFAAKMRLFETLLAPGAPAVIDADSAVAKRVIDICRARGLEVIDVGVNGEAIRLLSAEAGVMSTKLRIRRGDQEFSADLPLAGAFQVSNALVAAGLAIATGEAPAAVFGALAALKGAPGRLEFVGQRFDAPIFVDYAHKPDALEKLLAALRPLTNGRLIVVFGCGGDRDRGKRPLMGEIAGREADVVIVTDDNPRSEEPSLIRAAVLEGARAARRAEIVEIGDRRTAISHAIADLRTGDALVVAGKGHETGQIVGDSVLPFSDHAVIAAALQELNS